MEIFLDCLPCMLRQALDAARMATENELIQEKIMVETLKILSDYRNYATAPELSEVIQDRVKALTGVTDPYKAVKKADIEKALKAVPLIRAYSDEGEEPLLRALKVSATGNVLDSALYLDYDLEKRLKEELERPFALSDHEVFKKSLVTAREILIIADNAGEVVFDRILVDRLLKTHEVVYAVRERPILNDATLEEAQSAGIGEGVRLMSTGCGTPGTVMTGASQEFQEVYRRADLVISKGQGNFEALSDPDREVYFLLKAKCQRIARTLGVELGGYVFKRVEGR